jgi:hypothetical protein
VMMLSRRAACEEVGVCCMNDARRRRSWRCCCGACCARKGCGHRTTPSASRFVCDAPCLQPIHSFNCMHLHLSPYSKNPVELTDTRQVEADLQRREEAEAGQRAQFRNQHSAAFSDRVLLGFLGRMQRTCQTLDERSGLPRHGLWLPEASYVGGFIHRTDISSAPHNSCTSASCMHAYTSPTAPARSLRLAVPAGCLTAQPRFESCVGSLRLMVLAVVVALRFGTNRILTTAFRHGGRQAAAMAAAAAGVEPPRPPLTRTQALVKMKVSPVAVER